MAANPGGRTLTAGIVLALLYLGRSVLIPLALAILLSLLVAPLVRALRWLRVGRTFSVLVAVSAMGLACLGVAAAIGTQVLHIAASLPQYELNVQSKLKILEEVTAKSVAASANQLRLPDRQGSCGKLLAALWHPVQFAGVVLLVLIFVLLDHQSLRGIASSASPARPTYARQRLH